MPGFGSDTEADVLVEALPELLGGEVLQPTLSAAATSDEISSGRTSLCLLNIWVPFRAGLFDQRGRRRELEIEQRRVIIKNRLVKACQGVASGANGIEQLERRAFANF